MSLPDEQSHLFQLYNTLEEKLSCPNGCGTVCKRDPSQFLIMFVSDPHPRISIEIKKRTS
jgi:hypothetical protein